MHDDIRNQVSLTVGECVSCASVYKMSLTCHLWLSAVGCAICVGYQLGHTHSLCVLGLQIQGETTESIFRLEWLMSAFCLVKCFLAC